MYVVNQPGAANATAQAITPQGPVWHAARVISLQPRALAGLAALALLGACQASPGTSPAIPASPASYPDLADVPPRPQLSYTIEQRREVARALVADRENARYRAAVLAHATGRSDTAPTPPPPPPAAPAATPAEPAAPPPGERRIARGYVESSLNAAADDGDLRDFMRRMERPIPDPYGPRTVTQAVGLAPSEAGPDEEGGLAGFGSFLGGVLGLEPSAEEGGGPGAASP